MSGVTTSQRIHRSAQAGAEAFAWLNRAVALSNHHKEDRQVRKEKRVMVRQNGGHITKQEQKTLNKQENAIGK